MRPFRFLEALRSSYWFIPSMMALLALVLGALIVWLDVGPGSNWLDGLGWYQSAKADGAREVLSTVAGSMITVAGVVFSITIVALAYASSQYGPRVLTNFMGDRGNQVTLGTFIATFLYCLVVLRTIRGGDGAFVPHIAVLVGMLLGICSILVLIYFIHHVPQSIHINNVVARIGRQLIEDLDKRFPARIGGPAEPPGADGACAAAGEQDACAGEAAAVKAGSTGYIQAIDDQALIEAAVNHDLVVRLRYRPGDYVHAGRTLLEAWPKERVDEDVAAALCATYSAGTGRTPHGDLDFLVSELVEIAARALSPGVNDPITANTCLDWLGAAATEFAQRRMPPAERRDQEGRLRVIGRPESFDAFVFRAFGRVRQYVAGDMNSAVHMIRTLGEVAGTCRMEAQLRAVRTELDNLLATAEEKLDATSMATVMRRGLELKALLNLRPGDVDARAIEWLGGDA